MLVQREYDRSSLFGNRKRVIVLEEDKSDLFFLRLECVLLFVWLFGATGTWGLGFLWGGIVAFMLCAFFWVLAVEPTLHRPVAVLSGIFWVFATGYAVAAYTDWGWSGTVVAALVGGFVAYSGHVGAARHEPSDMQPF